MAVWLIVGLSCFATSCISKPTGTELSALEKTIREFQLSIRIDRTAFAPADFSTKALHAAWDLHHETLSNNPELDFNFSVHCLDWARIEAFFQALPHLPSKQLEQMRGNTIYLNSADIQLCSASPYSADQIKSTMQLVIPPITGAANQIMALKLVCNVSANFALENIEKAQATIANLSAQIENDEQSLSAAKDAEKSRLLEHVGMAKRQRFNAAHIWRINAMALCDNLPEKAKYLELYQSAQKAIQDFAVSTDYLSPKY